MTQKSVIAAKKAACLALVLTLALTATGCWDRRETDKLAIVGAIALDRISEGKWLVSAEVISTDAITGGTGQLGGQSKLSGWVLREEADTIPNAFANMQRRIPKRFFLGQVSTVVVGQNMAREGISACCDYLGMNPQFRRSMYLTTCDSGSGLLQRPYIHFLASQTLIGLIEGSADTGKASLVTLNEFLIKMSEPGIEPITLHTSSRATHDVAIKRPGEEVNQTVPGQPVPEPIESDVEPQGEQPPGSIVLDPLREQGTSERIPAVTILLGVGAFRGDKMVGFLDGNDARGYLWAAGRVGRAMLDVPNPFSASAGDLGLEVIRAPATLKVDIQSGRPVITIEVNVDLQGASWPMGMPLQEPGAVDAVEAAAKAMIEAEITQSLQIVREEFRTDIYGFGQAIYRRNPKLWWSIAEDWNDRGLQELQVNLQVRTRLRSPGGEFPRHRAR